MCWLWGHKAARIWAPLRASWAMTRVRFPCQVTMASAASAEIPERPEISAIQSSMVASISPSATQTAAFDFVGRGLRFTRIGLIGHFGRAHQHLLVPRDQENRACVHRLGENGGIRCARKTWQYDVGAANSTDHRTMRVDSGTLANSVGPR